MGILLFVNIRVRRSYIHVGNPGGQRGRTEVRGKGREVRGKGRQPPYAIRVLKRSKYDLIYTN